jgi:hypothetical protein
LMLLAPSSDYGIPLLHSARSSFLKLPPSGCSGLPKFSTTSSREI